MRVVLFASSMLAAVGQAMKLESLANETAEGAMPDWYAQTDSEQLGNMAAPDLKQLSEKAAKAIDKDD